MYFKIKNKQKQKDKDSTLSLVQFSMFCAIIAILGLTPLGFIPFFSFYIITVHIPVIIGSILLGPKKGAMLGLLFGITSLITAHITASPNSYFFSPFISGNFLSLVVCFVPRVLVGIVPYYVFNLCKKVTNQNISIIIASILGTLTNTVLVIGFICTFFAQKYADILGVDVDNLVITVIASIFINALLEVIVSAIIPVAILKVLLKFFSIKE